jgi:SAM-dependent methyltransferase
MENKSKVKFEIPIIFNAKKVVSNVNRAINKSINKDFINNPLHKVLENIENILVSHIRVFKYKFKNVLLIEGSQTINLGKKLKKIFGVEKTTHYVFKDNNIHNKYTKDCSNTTQEVIPFKNSDFDCIICVGTLNLVNDLPGILIQIRQNLTNNGIFLSSFIGGDSLKNIRKIIYEIESITDKKTNIHIHPLINPNSIPELLKRTGFNTSLITQDVQKVDFYNIFQIAESVRLAGEGNALSNSSPTTKKLWKTINNTTIFYDDSSKLREEFHIITISARY